jgi:hypothetical protein
MAAVRSIIRIVLLVVLILVVAAGVAIAWILYNQPRSGHVLDEALAAGRTAETFTAADDDYFHDMDGAKPLSTAEIRGRNTWIVWSGGNDWFWDVMTVKSAGALDFLKTISSHPLANAKRSTRWYDLGLVNEPCFDEAKGPDAKHWGLWLDQRKANCPADPFDNGTKYPGVKTGARGTTVNGRELPVGSFYGEPTGIVGLRLFPNPAFDDKAAKRWDAQKYYECSAQNPSLRGPNCTKEDLDYYGGKDLVRPYRVGMSCGFCHVGPNPVNPAADPNNPQWANLSSNVGAQYFWTDRIFYWERDDTNLAFQIFHAFRPGTLDTSFISTDNIVNPRTMNSVYQLLPRLLMAKRWGKETLAGGQRNNHQINDYLKDGPLADLYKAPDTVWTPRVLKDGADSVGVMGALNRVYLNIGTFGEEWLLHFNALVGGKRVTPIEIEVARKNSAYFKATEAQTFDTAQFFLKTTDPHLLTDAPGGAAYLEKDQKVLTRGKEVFADTCARCHSSKRPDPPVPGLDSEGCNGPNYLKCWTDYWAWTKTPEFKQKMRSIVLAPDFLKDNYLSAEFRVPVTLLQTNACSPLATNALGGNIWDNFSSQSYKDLPSVGQITWYDPYTGEPHQYQMPAGGRGYTRPPSLVSVWSSAPFLLNNTVGHFDAEGSIEGRMKSFDDAIHQMLWPNLRDKDSLLGDKIPGLIDRVGDRLAPGRKDQKVYLRVGGAYLPDFLQSGIPLGRTLFPWLFGSEGIEIGPVPPGTPIGLLANLNPLSEDPDPAKRAEYEAKVAVLVKKAVNDLKALGPNASTEQASATFKNLVPRMLELSKCPDFIVNRGHYFGTDSFKEEPGLSDSDKNALIALLKTF